MMSRDQFLNITFRQPLSLIGNPFLNSSPFIIKKKLFGRSSYNLSNFRICLQYVRRNVFCRLISSNQPNASTRSLLEHVYHATCCWFGAGNQKLGFITFEYSWIYIKQMAPRCFPYISVLLNRSLFNIQELVYQLFDKMTSYVSV